MANVLDSRPRMCAAAAARRATSKGVAPGAFGTFPGGAVLVSYQQFVERRARLQRLLAEFARHQPATGAGL